MDERVLNVIMRVIVTGLVVGMLGMIQPFSLALFKPAFLILFYCVIGYIVFSHFNPRPAAKKKEEPLGVDPGDAQGRKDA
jgi:hypothetical protein